MALIFRIPIPQIREEYFGHAAPVCIHSTPGQGQPQSLYPTPTVQ